MTLEVRGKAEQALVRLWIWKQRTDERVYVSTAPPGPRSRQSLRADGYKLYAVDVRLPDEAFVPEHDAVLEAGAQLLDDVPVHEGDVIWLVDRGDEAPAKRGVCERADGVFICVRWEDHGMVGSYTPESFRVLVESGRIKVNP